jgi:preprotein translocase subunit SecA
MVERMFKEVIDLAVDKELGEDEDDPAVVEAAKKTLQEVLRRKIGHEATALPKDPDAIKEAMLAAVKARYDDREREITPDIHRRIERFILLDAFDSKWKDHLHNMDALKSGIGLRSYANEDPKVAYKREGYSLFEEMLQSIQEQVTDYVLRIEVARDEDAEKRRQELFGGSREIKESAPGIGEGSAAMDSAANRSQSQEKPKPFKRNVPKVGRNDPCPCGSGKKYKHCHGAAEAGGGTAGGGAA